MLDRRLLGEGPVVFNPAERVHCVSPFAPFSRVRESVAVSRDPYPGLIRRGDVDAR